MASDHSPCPASDKEKGRADIFAAWGGVSGVQSMLPAVFTAARRRATGMDVRKVAAFVAWRLAAKPADRFGLGPQALAERHPGLVVVTLSAWGSRGPWGGRRGFDSIVQAASGIAMAESPDGERPGALPCQLLDHGTGYLCAAAALQALARQSARGGTQFRELSLARTAHWLLGQPREMAETPAPGDDEQTWLTTLDSAAGPVTTVLPPGRLDDEPLTWPQPLNRYGADDAAWSRPDLWLVWGRVGP